MVRVYDDRPVSPAMETRTAVRKLPHRRPVHVMEERLRYLPPAGAGVAEGAAPGTTGAGNWTLGTAFAASGTW